MQTSLKRHLRNPRFWQIALACYWLTLFVFTHLPIKRPELQGGKTDKVAHVAAFAVLGALLAITWQTSAGRLTARHLVWAWIALILYAGFEEITQPIVGRYCSIWDWSADAVGAALGLIIFACVGIKKHSH